MKYKVIFTIVLVCSIFSISTIQTEKQNILLENVTYSDNEYAIDKFHFGFIW